ncbi:helix-turn-helix transcriptional regulator [Ferruginibacter lapsinanis]|uniref:helix-turn-helix transcriptional regulator n=1 Tax=Ferruginibacter lapsinanis TaxID=563172 RepID=UPI001E39C7F9|nr:helix-turn-helix transcriptional regulator [Ferruginibacter lapsinanis]UEG49927.1 helix-turn-helix transcriptional regulator [Ferruginibacter lapsinanis]
MFYFNYNHTDYTSFLQAYAKAMGTTFGKDGVLHFPSAYGEGYHKLVVLPNGLQAIIIDVKLNQDFCVTRTKSDKEFYALRFDEVQIANSITVKFGREHFSEDEHNRSAVLLTSSLFDFGFVLKKGSIARGVNIMITKEWLATYLGIKSTDKVIQKYLALKTASFNFEPFDAEYRQLLTEIMEEEKRHNPMKAVVIQNRIMLLIERFFMRLYQKMSSKTIRNTLTNHEIQRLMNTEALLVSDFSVTPPTIPQLARKAAMSETKLKTLFKKIYGLSIYEYYQKNRMLKARHLLTTREYSIKEVGTMLNFKNLSNFTIAFKKEFNILPSDL